MFSGSVTPVNSFFFSMFVHTKLHYPENNYLELFIFTFVMFSCRRQEFIIMAAKTFLPRLKLLKTAVLEKNKIPGFSFIMALLLFHHSFCTSAPHLMRDTTC